MIAHLVVQTTRGVVPVDALVAATPEDRARGYTGRPAPVNDHTGILFLFPRDGLHAFHMTGVPFDLDLVLGLADGRVTGAGTMKGNSAGRHALETPIRFALELKAGWVARHGTPIRVSLP